MNARTEPDARAIDCTDIAIIGSGFAGLGLAIRLKQAGLDEFFIAEQAGAVGGTWRDNHYPGCACDVQSNLYSFSFAPNPDWTRRFAPQVEIRRYLEDCVVRFGLQPHLRFAMALRCARYDDSNQRWVLDFADGRRVSARVLITAMGALSRPAVPDIPGLERFQGACFHSQQWDHDYALAGKRVAVIGTGASAIQFVPRIAPEAAQLRLFQRTPPWIMHRPDRPLTRLERWAYRHLPFTQMLSRRSIYWLLETRVLGFAKLPQVMKLVQRFALRHLRRQVVDPALRERLTPNYTIGCKRVLMSNDYYPALCRDNVSLISDPIARVEEDAVVTEDGTRHRVDCIILGTGFRATDPFPRGMVMGRHGVDIVDAWSDGPRAYLGTTLSGFPNLFMTIGPNTGLGHSSMVLMIEAQATYIVNALAAMRDGGIAAIDVKPEVELAYNRALQTKLARTVWSTGGCRSWYLDPRTGKNTVLWPGATWRFRQLTARFSLRDYTVPTGTAHTDADAAPPTPRSVARDPSAAQVTAELPEAR